MASYSIFIYLAYFFIVSSVCHSFNRKVLNAPSPYGGYEPAWYNTIATFYGERDGPGSLGGACGYQTAVQQEPYNSRIAAVEPSLYEEGAGCGVCYLINCSYSFCSGNPVKVVVTDLCPEGSCIAGEHLFDLSGASVEDLAKPGQEDQLRQLGDMEIQYHVTECGFKEANVAFRVDPGSGGNYFAAAIEFQNGGEIVRVEVKEANSTDWLLVTRSWGTVFKVVFSHPYVTPLSFRVTDKDSQTITAYNVIPADYKIDKTYESTVNFND